MEGGGAKYPMPKRMVCRQNLAPTGLQSTSHLDSLSSARCYLWLPLILKENLHIGGQGASLLSPIPCLLFCLLYCRGSTRERPTALGPSYAYGISFQWKVYGIRGCRSIAARSQAFWLSVPSGCCCHYHISLYWMEASQLKSMSGKGHKRMRD